MGEGESGGKSIERAEHFYRMPSCLHLQPHSGWQTALASVTAQNYRNQDITLAHKA